MDDQYFVIWVDANGDAYMENPAKETLLKRLDEGYYGPNPASSHIPAIPDGEMAEWTETLIIIKGRHVIPLPVTTVTKFDLP